MTLKDKLSILKKKILTTAMFLSSLTGTAVSAQNNFGESAPNNTAKISADNKKKVVHRNQMGPGKLKTGSERMDTKLEEMRRDGAFYLDYKKYRETGSVENSVVYFTNNEIDSLGLHKLPISPFAVSLARENYVLWQGNEHNDSLAMIKYNKARITAICNIKGIFYGEFQFTERNIAKAILYGLVQKRNPELQKFCQGFIRPDASKESRQRFERFRQSYLTAVEKFDNGEGTRQDLLRARFGWKLNSEFDRADGLFSMIDYTRPTFHKLSLANPLMSRQMQETFAVNVYMVMAVESEKICRHLDPMTAGSVFASMIHLPNSKSTRDILFNPDNSPEEICKKLISKDGKPTDADNRMEIARKKVYNNGYYTEQFCQDFSWMTNDPLFWESFLRAEQQIALRDVMSKNRPFKEIYINFPVEIKMDKNIHLEKRPDNKALETEKSQLKNVKHLKKNQRSH